jgi:hypothetical protein
MPIYVATFSQLVIRGDLKTEHRRVYMYGNCHVSWMLVRSGRWWPVKKHCFSAQYNTAYFVLCQSKFPPVGTSICQLCYLFFVSLYCCSHSPTVTLMHTIYDDSVHSAVNDYRWCPPCSFVNGMGGASLLLVTTQYPIYLFIANIVPKMVQ